MNNEDASSSKESSINPTSSNVNTNDSTGTENSNGSGTDEFVRRHIHVEDNPRRISITRPPPPPPPDTPSREKDSSSPRSSDFAEKQEFEKDCPPSHLKDTSSAMPLPSPRDPIADERTSVVRDDEEPLPQRLLFGGPSLSSPTPSDDIPRRRSSVTRPPPPPPNGDVRRRSSVTKPPPPPPPSSTVPTHEDAAAANTTPDEPGPGRPSLTAFDSVVATANVSDSIDAVKSDQHNISNSDNNQKQALKSRRISTVRPPQLKSISENTREGVLDSDVKSEQLPQTSEVSQHSQDWGSVSTPARRTSLQQASDQPARGSFSDHKRPSVSRKTSLTSPANRRASLIIPSESTSEARLESVEMEISHAPDLVKRNSFLRRVSLSNTSVKPESVEDFARRMSLQKPDATPELLDLEEKEGEFALRALNFGGVIEEKRAQHYPETREWLIKQVMDWMANPEGKKLFWLMGDAGMGKSVVAVKVMDRAAERVVGWHFCRHDDPTSSNPTTIIKSLCAMMCERLPGFSEELEAQNEESRTYCVTSDRVEEVFKILIFEPLSRLPPPPKTRLLVLDALDELPRDTRVRGQCLSLITQHFSRLPAWLLLFVTSRAELDIVQAFKSKYSPYELTVDQASNRADLRAYLSHLARRFSKSMSVEEMEIALESVKDAKGELVFPGLDIKGKLARLEEPLRRSKATYDEVADRVKHEKLYGLLVELKEQRPAVPPAQPVEDLDTLFQHANEARTRLMDWIAKQWEVKVKTSHGCVMRPVPRTQKPWVQHAVDPGVKGRARAVEKMTKDYNNDPRLLKDLARQTLSYEACVGLYRGLEFLQSDEARRQGFEVIQLKNKFGNPTPMGYRDFNVSLRVKLDCGEWHICEVQLNLEAMLVAKDQAHQYYEKVRSALPDLCAVCCASPELLEHHVMKMLESSVRDSAIQALEDKAQGLFIYAKLLEDHLDKIQREQKSNVIEFDKLVGLPDGLDQIYRTNFFRAFPDGPTSATWRASARLVALVVVAQEPLPAELASRILGASTLGKAQSDLSLLFPVSGQDTFRVLHKSVVDWLRNPKSAFHITPKEMLAAHRDLGNQSSDLRFRLNLSSFRASAGLDGVWRRDQHYCFRHGVKHLIEANMAPEAGRLMLDEAWLTTRCTIGDFKGINKDAALVNAATQMPYYDLFVRTFLSSFLRSQSQRD